MNKFQSLNKAINWIESQRRFDDKKDLTKLKNAFKLLNINFDNTKKVHIVGTNGKGSTTAFMSNVLTNNNIKVGAFTSPYLISFNERIKINNINISNNELLKLINFIYKFNETNSLKLTFFELITLMSFYYFYKNNCDVILIEAGIGARLDSTNIIKYDLTIITSIGFDHINILGNTYENIIYEKTGSLNDSSTLITYSNNKYNKYINDRVNNFNSNLKLIKKTQINKQSNEKYKYKNIELNLKLKGIHQIENAILSYEAIKHLYNFEDSLIIKHLNETVWPGRFEEIDKKIFIDGAHNEHAIKALINTINTNYKSFKVNILFSALKDKEVSKMIELLNNEKYNITLTKFSDPRYESLKKYETKKINFEDNYLNYIKRFKENKEKNEILVITGSLYFIGEVKKILK